MASLNMTSNKPRNCIEAHVYAEMQTEKKIAKNIAHGFSPYGEIHLFCPFTYSEINVYVSKGGNNAFRLHMLTSAIKILS